MDVITLIFELLAVKVEIEDVFLTDDIVTMVTSNILRWLTTVLIDYNSSTSNSFEKCSKTF